ncbi:MAG: corrinoid protein [Bacillota bacterium]|nr:corrinoid protein [Bacillota bacterium]
MEVYELMKEAVLDGDEEEAVKLAEQALNEGLDLQQVMDEGFLAGIQEAGQLYEDEEYFLPDLVCSADAMKCALEVLDEAMKNDPKAQAAASAKIALVTVQGDVHDIGKTIVGAMMTAAGFEVYDLGTDVPNEEVISKVKEIKPDILGLSALLTTTMEEQGSIIKLLETEGLRDQVKVMIGGAPVNQEWAEKITADGYSDNAIAAVRLAEQLMS